MAFKVIWTDKKHFQSWLHSQKCCRNWCHLGFFIMISKHVAWLEDTIGVAPSAIMKKVFFKTLLNFHKKICVGVSFSINLLSGSLQLHQIETTVHVLSFEFYEILEKIYFIIIWERLLLKNMIFSCGVSFRNASGFYYEQNKIKFWTFK